jgi:hypothetical protein
MSIYVEDTPVLVRYPLPGQRDSDREGWPWLPGTVTAVCGPDEWQVCVEDPRVQVRKDGSPVTPRTPRHNRYYPLCYRDASEIKPQEVTR